jgi:hypothetical protein
MVNEPILDRYEILKRDHGFTDADIAEAKIIDEEYILADTDAAKKFAEQKVANRIVHERLVADLFNSVQRARVRRESQVRDGDEKEKS